MAYPPAAASWKLFPGRELVKLLVRRLCGTRSGRCPARRHSGVVQNAFLKFTLRCVRSICGVLTKGVRRIRRVGAEIVDQDEQDVGPPRRLLWAAVASPAAIATGTMAQSSGSFRFGSSPDCLRGPEAKPQLSEPANLWLRL